MNRTEKLLRCLRILVTTALICGLFALFFISYLMAQLWHAMRGSSVSFDTWRVPIPRGYSPWFDDRSFFAFSFGAPFIRKEGYGHIRVFTHRNSGNHSPQQIETAVMTVAKRDGYVLEDRRTVESSAGANYCFQFAVKLHPAEIDIRCVNASGGLFVFFEGSRRFSGDVYTVVSGLQRL